MKLQKKFTDLKEAEAFFKKTIQQFEKDEILLEHNALTLIKAGEAGGPFYYVEDGSAFIRNNEKILRDYMQGRAKDRTSFKFKSNK